MGSKVGSQAAELFAKYGDNVVKCVDDILGFAKKEGLELALPDGGSIKLWGDSAGNTVQFAAKKSSNSSIEKYKVGAYKDIKGGIDMDAHHVGQKAVMEKLVEIYDWRTAPSISVPKEGHTIKGDKGIVKRSTKGVTSAWQLLARDFFELKRVYADIPNSSLKELIEMNKRMYLEMRK